MRVDFEADPKIVEAAEAAGEVPCGQAEHDVGVQGGRQDGYDRRVCGLGLGRGQAAAQEHIRRLGDRGRDRGQELVAYSTWQEPQFCQGGVLCNRDGRSRGACGASTGGRAGLEDVCQSSYRLVCRQGSGVSAWFGETATHRVEVLVGPRIGTRTEDRDQEDQRTRQPADCLTKPKDFKCFEPLLSRLGARWRSSTSRRNSS